MSDKWYRVTKANRCRICEKPDWCTYTEKVACCMRIHSDRPVRNGGWLHPLDGQVVKLPPRPPPAPSINATRLIQEWLADTTYAALEFLSDLLGVTIISLQQLECAWAAPYSAYAFPMRDGYGNRVGIRLRAVNGDKWAVRGSHAGLFIPDTRPERTVFICEGPTDAAALLSIGLFAIGRPSCSGCLSEVNTFLKRADAERCVILADNDTPGQTGANTLAAQLRIPSSILVPPAKDVRQFVQFGGTANVLISSIEIAIWRMPQ